MKIPSKMGPVILGTVAILFIMCLIAQATILLGHELRSKPTNSERIFVK